LKNGLQYVQRVLTGTQSTRIGLIKLAAGVRQCGVLSHILFAIYIDDLIECYLCVVKHNTGCIFHHVNLNIVVYADDILLLAPSIHWLQLLLLACEHKLWTLGLELNIKKSMCLRIVPRCHVSCSSLTLLNGSQIARVDNIRYLGVYLRCFRYFSCCFDRAKRSFFAEVLMQYSEKFETAYIQIVPIKTALSFEKLQLNCCEVLVGTEAYFKPLFTLNHAGTKKVDMLQVFPAGLHGNNVNNRVTLEMS